MATSETDRFAAFFRMLGHTSEPFQRQIVEEIFSERRETLVLIPRGNGKSPLVETTTREIRTDAGWLKVIAADGFRQHGLILDMAICDELHAHARRDLYDALRTSMLKRPGARMVTISTALGGAARARHQAVREQAASVHELAFARFHANVWTGGEAPWVTADGWDACKEEPEIPEESEVVLRVDASIRHDTTAIVVVRMEGDVFHALWRTWTPVKGREVSLAEAEAFVREVAGHFTVRACVHDPHYFWHAGQRLEDEGIPMLEWQHARMASATRTLHEVVAHGRLRHGGDETARRHALAAEVREREYGLTISKRASRDPIDCLVALAMAVEFASSVEPPKRSVYEQRGQTVRGHISRVRGPTFVYAPGPPTCGAPVPSPDSLPRSGIRPSQACSRIPRCT